MGTTMTADRLLELLLMTLFAILLLGLARAIWLGATHRLDQGFVLYFRALLLSGVMCCVGVTHALVHPPAAQDCQT